MKRLLTVALAMIFAAGAANAQSYKTAIGLGIDAGNPTMAGLSLKHFFNEKGAMDASLVFGGNSTMATALYGYHGAIANAGGLKYYIGAGPSLVFPKGADMVFGLRPLAGLDFKLPNAPLELAFDWRPAMWFGNGNNNFEGGRVGLGFRYVLR